MQKVVVVDDEVRQCRGLKNILTKHYQNVEVEAFTSALPALEYIKEEKVRIVITDICMPDMNGLEFTEQIKNTDAETKVILLTGFAEFEYARKAVSLGAFDYLLKPLNPEKLWEVFERAVEEIGHDEVLKEEHHKMQEKLDMTFPVYMEKLLNQWVYGYVSKQEKEEVRQIIPEDEAGFVIVTRLYGLTRFWAEKTKEKTERIKEQIVWWMREKIKNPWHSLSFFSNILQNTLVTVVTCRNNYYLKNQKKEIERLVGQLRSQNLTIEIDGGMVEIPIFMGIGEMYESIFGNIEKGYESAVTVSKYSFYFPELSLLQAEYLEIYEKGSGMTISLVEEELVREAIKKQDGEEAYKNFSLILQRCLANAYPEPEQFKNVMKNFLGNLMRSLRKDVTFMYEFLGEKEDNIDNFCGQVKEFLLKSSKSFGEKYSGKERNVEFAVNFSEYLKEHYKEEVSLDNIAAYFSLTPAYCSTLIKEVTGSNFSKMLVDRRIEEAKKLLKETDLRIYEISMEIGYKDVKYFNRTFKKETGITPLQYREELLALREG